MQNDPNQTNSLNPGARRNARHFALQAMYQWHIAGTPVPELEKDFLENRLDKPTDRAYFLELIRTIPSEQANLDKTMQPYLGRLLEEMDPIELTVLRLSVYELLHRPDVPYRVVINEALELTKKFGSIEGYKFVNGVLDRVAKQHRATEIAAAQNKPLDDA